MNLYDVTIVLNSLSAADGTVTAEAQILVGPVTLMASSPLSAATLAGRTLTDDQVASPSRLAVIVNPRAEV